MSCRYEEGFLVNNVILHLSDAGYADTLLANARQVYEFGYNNRGIYSDTIPAQDFYG